MSKYILILFSGLCLLDFSSIAQGSAYVFKGGLSIASQNYEGYQREALIASHVCVSIESLDDEDKYALYAQAGYHTRGSAIRVPTFTNNQGEVQGSRTFDWRFNNISLALGARQKFGKSPNLRWYYGVALRGEYNVKTSINDFFPQLADLTNNFVYGVSASVGTEYMFSELVGGVLELSVHPDLSNQITVPAQRSVGSLPAQPERRVRNLTIELSLGIRLLHLITYID